MQSVYSSNSKKHKLGINKLERAVKKMWIINYVNVKHVKYCDTIKYVYIMIALKVCNETAFHLDRTIRSYFPCSCI